ncbi:YsnF/AvaK domain-containing protein [Clostridium cellulovorans]|uniref:DUF2382 domain-containing protein n=1 Tax=Clostridium cellulovorans (strain ATCC 35296 / DSM 3052 / OCM 3 / 743B) TaxID=573061 RepID=D9SNF4_CLOC7|nr:YsnF/AvaK domain-containing protein [Clostridium cellulovorans]ADL53946.1 Domain of unknown function DUF2382-like [Clostridium cellulovorans 743B]
MSIFGGIFGDSDDDNIKKTTDDAKLQLRKEELNVEKSKIQKGEVEFGKEIIEEHKELDIPVSREEVVIERRSLDNESTDSPIANEETIRIPVTEEKVNVGKRTVITGEVSAHKRTLEETEHINETVRREEARVNTIGDADIIDTDNNEY